MSKKPIIAIMYDFDKTLCNNDMQNYAFIPSLGISVDDFWSEVNKFSKQNNMDGLLCYMYMMLKKAREKDIPVRREDFVKLGKKIEYFPGVEEWFERIREFGKKQGVIVEHYIISSGLKEMIEGTAIAKEFEKIYASSFLFDDKEVPIWPAQAINYTNKTQFLFKRIHTILTKPVAPLVFLIMGGWVFFRPLFPSSRLRMDTSMGRC